MFHPPVAVERFAGPGPHPEPFSLRLPVRLSGDHVEETFLLLGDPANPVLTLKGIPAGRDPARAGWEDKGQNYLAYPDANGRCRALEARLLCGSDDGRPREVRVGVPAALVGVERTLDVVLRSVDARFELWVDGVLVDSDTPSRPALPLSFANLPAGAVVMPAEPPPTGNAERATEIFGPPEEGAQYWTPRGHNTWMGDTMSVFWRGRFHLFYLFHRRHGRNEGSTGGHAIAHLSSADLRRWEEHPVVVPVDHHWLTCGTGTLLEHEGKLWLFYGLHSDRHVPEAVTIKSQWDEQARTRSESMPIPWGENGLVPLGTTYAVSEDGVHFRPANELIHGAQNPGVHRLEGDDEFVLLAGYGRGHDGRFVSRDLRHWTLEDTFPVPAGPSGAPARLRNTNECQVLFEWNGWHYLIAGRTGFWMARSAQGPFWDRDSEEERAAEQAHRGPHPFRRMEAEGEVVEPRWDIYDGLWVPSVAPFGEDRRILAGFLAGPDFDWGGHLVFREFVQRPDGMLGLKWPAELVPSAHPPIALGVGTVSPDEPWSHALPESGAIFSAEVSLAAPADAVALVFSGEDAGESACELRVDRTRRTAQWGTVPADGGFAPDVPTAAEHLAANPDLIIWEDPQPPLPFCGGNFAIAGVEELDAPFLLRVIAFFDPKSRSTIIDAEVAGHRTLITRRPGLRATRLTLRARGGRAEICAAGLAPLVR